MEVAFHFFFLLVVIAIVVNDFGFGMHADTAHEAGRGVNAFLGGFGSRELDFKNEGDGQVEVFETAPLHMVYVVFRVNVLNVNRYGVAFLFYQGDVFIAEPEALVF